VSASIERVRAFLRAVEDAVCDETRPARCGTALLTPSLPLVWSLNALRVEGPDADVGEVVDEAERLLGTYGHRRLIVHDERVATKLAPGLAERGWNVDRLLAMEWRRSPERAVDTELAVEADRTVGAATLAAFRREQPFGWQEEAVRQLAEMDGRYTRSAAARDFVAPADRPAAACRLYLYGPTGQVDEVGTVEARRGRGYASAAVLAAAHAARDDGRDFVFLLTNAADWPQKLYGRLGFDPIGSVYEFLKLPLGASRP
jgi:GNAT superfamily N-acetyltransferase